MRALVLSIRNRLSNFKPKEIVQSYWQIQKKVQQLHQLLNQSKYPIFFTGAGISTSLGIPDYRSGTQTIIKTGPGLWNRDLHPHNPHQIPIDKLVDMVNPSLSHMLISTLIRKGIVKHLISQNTDGLHLRSGVSIQNISELHGNRNLEHCIKCLKKYSRDFRTLKRDGKKYQPGQKRDHNTGRACENCGGDLHDSIIYFGEKLPREKLQSAIHHASKADLCICLGSSLTVKPSANIPQYVVQKPQGKMCIVNIQETPLDQLAALRIYYFCDDVMELLSKKLGIDIDKLTIKHYFRIALQRANEQIIITIEGKDKNKNNLSFIKGVRLKYQSNEHFQDIQIIGHKCQLSLSIQKRSFFKSITVYHFGQKPPLQLPSQLFQYVQDKEFYLSYQLEDSNWRVSNDNI